MFLSVALSLFNSSSPITIVNFEFILSEYLNCAFTLLSKWSLSALMWFCLKSFNSLKLFNFASSPIVTIYISVDCGFLTSLSSHCFNGGRLGR